MAFMGSYGSNTMWEEKWEFCHSDGFGQENFDIDLGKKVIYTGSNWYDLLGNLVE